MADLHSDQAQELFRPFGGGLPRKGKSKAVPRKKKPAPVSDAVEAGASAFLTDSTPIPPPPKLVRPVFQMPPPNSSVWDEVLTEVASVPRPPSVPVKVAFQDSKELPHWHDMPRDELGSAATQGTMPPVEPTSPAGGAAPAGPEHFVAKEDAELLGTWLEELGRPQLAAAARDAEEGLTRHVILALPVERVRHLTRRIGLVARPVQDETGALCGYAYPQAGHEKVFVTLPWTQRLPLDEDNDLAIKLRQFASRLRRLRL